MVSGLRKLTTQRARRLRRNETDAERILWRELRGRDSSFPKFRRQHPVPPYILDFVCRPKKFAIEIDGATHGSPEEIAYDEKRTHFLNSKGWHVERYTNEDIYNELNDVLGDIELKLKF